MIRVVIKLVLIFLVIYVATKAGYAHLEKRLLAGALAGDKKAPLAGQVVASAKDAAPAKDAGGPSAPGKSPEPVAASKQTTDYGIIVTRNIFQAALDESEQDDKASRKIVTEPPPDTELPLSLQGTIAGDKEARAVIRDDKTKKQDIYRVGDPVGGALIKSIERGKIILEVNGREEALFLEERKGGGPGIAAPPSSVSNRITPRRIVRPSRRTPPVQPRRRLTLDREKIRQDGEQEEEPDVFEPDEPLEDEEFPEDVIEESELDSPEPPSGENDEGSLDAGYEPLPGGGEADEQ